MAKLILLEKEFKYFLEHQDELVKRFDGKFVVIKNEEVLGAYANQLKAIEKTSEKHELGTFLVQKCEPGEESYTQTFRGGVIFNENPKQSYRKDIGISQ